MQINPPVLVILALSLLCLGSGLALLVLWASQTAVENGRKKVSWPEFARTIAGTYTEGAASQPDVIKARIAEWPVYIDTYIVGVNKSLMNYTRLRAFFPVRTRFELFISTPGRSKDWRTATQPSLIEITDVDLGKDLLVMTNNEYLAQQFTMAKDVMALVNAIKPLDLQVRRRRNWQNGGISNSVYEVHAQQEGVITDLKQLGAVYALVTASLIQLQRMGVAGSSFSDSDQTQ